MNRWTRSLAGIAIATLAIGCGNGTSTDAGDVASADVEASVSVDVQPMNDVVVTMSPAGAQCTSVDQCTMMPGGAGFDCFAGIAGGLCTRQCANSAAQSTEQLHCGGPGSTCVALGDGPGLTGYCERTCDPTLGAAACRTGFVCTGWWFTHTGGVPDRTGCWTLCSQDAHCPVPMTCNARTGRCGDPPVNPSRHVDGVPCNPANVMGPSSQSTECRGSCFSVSAADPALGICGSLVNRLVATQCPDGPAVQIAGPPTDQLGLCLLRTCTTSCDCALPLVCRDRSDGVPGTACQYPNPPDNGIACGGDGGTDASDATVATDASDATVALDAADAGPG